MEREVLGYLVRNRVVRSNVVLSVAAATICFFLAFASLVVFSPTIGRIGPLLNITASEQAALLAMPSITGSLLRPLFSVLSLRFGTRALFIAGQSVGSLGLIGLCLTMFLVSDFQGLYGLFVVLGLLAGVSGEFN